MKTGSAIISLLLVFSVAFAEGPIDERPGENVRALVTPPPIASPEEILRLLAASHDIAVPLPVKTRFDAERGDRLAYRKAYRRGYRFTAATGLTTTTSWADIPHREAHIAGYYDGQAAAQASRLR